MQFPLLIQAILKLLPKVTFGQYLGIVLIYDTFPPG